MARNTEQEVPPQTAGGPGPDSPLELAAPDWKVATKRAVKEFKADRGGMTAGGLAYYWFLAIFPGLLAAVGFLGLVPAGSELIPKLEKGLPKVLPGDAATVLTEAVKRAQEQSGGASVLAALVGLLLALWSASAGMVALQTSLDVAYDVPEERKFVGKRLVALALVVVTAVCGGIATALVVFGASIGDSIRDNLPLGGAFVIVWTAVRWLAALVALLVLFATYYYLGPKRESPRWVWVSPGGIIAVLIWLAASLGFSFYVAEFGQSSYAKTYGSLSGVVVLILWLYLTALAVVFGGEVNAELERQAEHRTREERRTGTRRPPSQAGRGAASTGAPEQAVSGVGDAPSRSVAEWRARMASLRDGGRDRVNGTSSRR